MTLVFKNEKAAEDCSCQPQPIRESHLLVPVGQLEKLSTDGQPEGLYFHWLARKKRRVGFFIEVVRKSQAVILMFL